MDELNNATAAEIVSTLAAPAPKPEEVSVFTADDLAKAREQEKRRKRTFLQRTPR